MTERVVIKPDLPHPFGLEFKESRQWVALQNQTQSDWLKDDTPTNVHYPKIVCPGKISVKLIHSSPANSDCRDGKRGDYLISSAARISFTKSNKKVTTKEEDLKLTRYLLKNSHTSPFEMCNLTFVIKAPKFVTIQLLRHRTSRLNEESQRYSEIQGGYLKPSVDPNRFIRRQNRSMKQCSVTDTALATKALDIVKETEVLMDKVIENYHEMIKMGVAKEVARYFLPLAMFSRIVMQIDLNNFLKFLVLRLDNHAQYEIQLVARSMYWLAKRIFPDVMTIFDEEKLKMDTMSVDTDGFIFK